MKICNECDTIFEEPRRLEEFDCDVCPQCLSEDISEYDAGYEAYNATQRCPHEKAGWEDE
jgi:hypothetical protein